MELTQEYLKTLFDYKDGFLYWKTTRSSRTKPCDLAGSLNKKINRWCLKILKQQKLNSRMIFLYHKGYLPKQVDHIDTNQLNDRIENLREATQQQNCYNRTSVKNTTSKYKGVSIKTTKKKNGKEYKMWCTQLHLKGEKKVFKLFAFNRHGEIDAALYYNKLAVKHFGEFANLNIVLP